MTNGHTTGGHSYRNFDPNDFIERLESATGDAEELELMDELDEDLNFIESGRFEPMVARISDFFFKLDTDEQRFFTDRNPDLVQWMSVYNRINGFNPYQRWFDIAADHLTGTATRKRVGMTERTVERMPGPDYEPPPFRRRDVPDDRTLLDDMRFRRRSYRNWTPGEFLEIAEEDHELTRPQAEELTSWDDDVLDNLDFPVDDVDGQTIALTLLERIEAGRFFPILTKMRKFFAPLDFDERAMVMKRNPGLSTWLGTFGSVGGKFESGEFMVRNTDVEWPPLKTIDHDDTLHGEVRQEAIAEVKKMQEEFEGP